ncbi:aquaporin [Ruegeria arenilitoris]|uniref:aquaporin n=1 Tax=Ruegeria arenilitoris TaxID=1173585 RepID=UPI00147DB741|nr:MIP/aquaporin family protein [Ruegeria arenilitoris]
MQARQYFAEFLGTAFLLIGVVGSGIMAQTLSEGNVALALLANAIATGCILFVIIATLGPVSGAHFNPAVTLAFAMRGEHPWKAVAPYILVQLAGGIIGVWASHYMFDLPILQTSETLHRTGSHQWFSEIIATLGLLFVIFGGIRHKPDTVPALVGLYITGAYWYTSSTSFANPAVTIARGLTDTFAGIYPGHIPMFILMQIFAMFIGHIVLNWLFNPAD